MRRSCSRSSFGFRAPCIVGACCLLACSRPREPIPGAPPLTVVPQGPAAGPGGDAALVPAASDVPTPKSCKPPPVAPSTGYELRYDQLGYLPSADKWAVLVSEGKPAPGYRILDART